MFMKGWRDKDYLGEFRMEKLKCLCEIEVWVEWEC